MDEPDRTAHLQRLVQQLRLSRDGFRRRQTKNRSDPFAANEEAVQRFLHRELSFLGIPQLVEQVLQLDWQVPVQEIVAILQVDREARIKFEEIWKS